MTGYKIILPNTHLDEAIRAILLEAIFTAKIKLALFYSRIITRSSVQNNGCGISSPSSICGLVFSVPDLTTGSKWHLSAAATATAVFHHPKVPLRRPEEVRRFFRKTSFTRLTISLFLSVGIRRTRFLKLYKILNLRILSL